MSIYHDLYLLLMNFYFGTNIILSKFMIRIIPASTIWFCRSKGPDFINLILFFLKKKKKKKIGFFILFFYFFKKKKNKELGSLIRSFNSFLKKKKQEIGFLIRFFNFSKIKPR